MASVEMKWFEQMHCAALINDGFDGLNHLRKMSSVDLEQMRKNPPPLT
jgi:hypothetical protein